MLVRNIFEVVAYDRFADAVLDDMARSRFGNERGVLLPLLSMS